MKLLIINQFFYPDKSATSQLLTDLAHDLVARGIDVTVLCSQSGYLGEKTSASETWNGINIVRLASTKFSKSSMWGRLSSYLSFYLAVSLALLRMPKFDVVMVLTTPPLIAFVPAVLRSFRRTKLVYVVQDLYPDIAIALGYMKPGSPLARVLEAVSRFSLRRADRVITVGECARRLLLRKKIPAERISIIQNWSNSGEIVPLPKSENPFVQAHQLQDKFVVLYSGNMGSAHDISTLVDAACRLKNNSRIQFVFIGDGVKKAEIEAAKQNHSLSNVLLLPYVKREELSYSMGSADACLVSQLPETCGLMVPSKIYGIMSAAKPLLFVGPVEGEAARTIQQNSCGFVIPNGAADQLVTAIESLARNPGLCARMGSQARSSLVNHFDRAILTARYFDLLNQLLPATASIATEAQQQARSAAAGPQS